MEEYSVLTGKLLRWTLVGVILLHVALLIVERFSWWRIALGLVTHVVYFTLLRKFPCIDLLGPSSIAAAGMVVSVEVFVCECD